MRNAEEMYQTPFSNALGSGMEFFEVLGKRRSHLSPEYSIASDLFPAMNGKA